MDPLNPQTPTTPQYEFDAGQNTLIGSLAGKMGWVSTFMMALAVVAAVGGAMTLREQGVSTMLEAVLLFVVALWTRRAAQAFGAIVATERSDISNLMIALRQLRNLYTLQFWMLMLAIILVVASLIMILTRS